MAQSYELMGEKALRALVQSLQTAEPAGSADSVLTVVGGKVRSMSLDSLVELVAGSVVLRISVTPSDAKVYIDNVERSAAVCEYGCEVEWRAECEGYITKSGSLTMTENVTMSVELLRGVRFTIIPTPEDADVYINGERTNSVLVEEGGTVEWEVSKDGYTTKTGTQTVDEDTELEVEIVGEPFTFVYDNNSMYIYRGTTMDSSTEGLFSINGDYDIEINGVMIEDVADSTTFGSEYLNDTGNIVKIYPYEGVTINHRCGDFSYRSTRNQTRYISEIQSWGGATFGVVTYMFAMSGRGASTLKRVPKFTAGFAGVTSMAYMFYYCDSITELADGLFGNCTAATNFTYCFYYCSGLTSLPTGLFDNCTAATDFTYCFYYCSGLTSLPTGLFDNCTAATNFTYCFCSCSGLTSLPEDLFANNTAVTTFERCFMYCSGLDGAEIPANFFANCTKVTSFSYCFIRDSDRNTGYLAGRSAYDLVEIDGVATVIHLYERENYPDLYTAPTTTTSCYRNQTKLDDYNSIPDGWK